MLLAVGCAPSLARPCQAHVWHRPSLAVAMCGGFVAGGLVGLKHGGWDGHATEHTEHTLYYPMHRLRDGTRVLTYDIVAAIREVYGVAAMSNGAVLPCCSMSSRYI